MDYFAMAMQALQLAAAAADAFAKAKEMARITTEAAKQSGEMTQEQSDELDAKSEAIFAAPESQQSGR